jgi:hypothetical protein
LGFLDRLLGGSGQPGSGGSARSAPDPAEVAFSPEFEVDHGVPDVHWIEDSRRSANALAGEIEGSAESYGEAAKVRYNRQDFGAAMVLFCKALDLIHTQYLVLNMQHRQPSPADAWIVDGFVAAVGASLAMHPDAPIDEEVREGTHRLLTIASMCERVGASSFLYRNALDQLETKAPHVRTDDILRH